MTKETPTPAAGVMLGRYRVASEVGRGGMGVVYAAVDETLARRVAVKTLSVGLLGRDREARMTRFQREVRALAQLDHPGILHIYDAGEADDPVVGWVLYYSMELIEGETLSERLIRCGAMPRGAACAVVARCAEALGAAHARGIVHRDVKPANIFLAGSSRVVVADFGVCKIEGGTEITRKDQMVGTPSYLAPEQILGLGVDPRTDVFALGALLYVLISNSALRPQLDRAGLSRLAATDDAAWRARHMPHSDDALRAVVARALAREPSERYASGAELAEALEPFASRVPDPFEEPAASTSTRNAALVNQANDSNAFTHAGNTSSDSGDRGADGEEAPAPAGAPELVGDTLSDSAPPPVVSDEVPERARALADSLQSQAQPIRTRPAMARAVTPLPEESTERNPAPFNGGTPPPDEDTGSDRTEEAVLPPKTNTRDEETEHVRRARAQASGSSAAAQWAAQAAVVMAQAARQVGVWLVGLSPRQAGALAGAAALLLGTLAVVMLRPRTQQAPVSVAPVGAANVQPVAAPAARPQDDPIPEMCLLRTVPVQAAREAALLTERAAGMEKRDPRRARNLYDKAVGLDGQCWQAHEGLARVLLDQGDRQQARVHLRCVAHLRSGEPEGRQARAALARTAGVNQKAP